MEFLSISQVQSMINDDPSCFVEQEEENKMPALSAPTRFEELEEEPEEPEEELEEPEEPEETTKDPMKYIDHMFMVCGFVRLVENEKYTKNNISRMYSNSNGLCVSLKCGIAYKSSFLYENKIEYMYPSASELMEYIKSTDENNIGDTHYYELVDPSKIMPYTFEIIIFKQDHKPMSENSLKAFEETFLNCTNTSVSSSGYSIIITYAPVCQDDKLRVSVESFVKFLSPSW